MRAPPERLWCRTPAIRSSAETGGVCGHVPPPGRRRSTAAPSSTYALARELTQKAAVSLAHRMGNDPSLSACPVQVRGRRVAFVPRPRRTTIRMPNSSGLVDSCDSESGPCQQACRVAFHTLGIPGQSYSLSNRSGSREHIRRHRPVQLPGDGDRSRPSVLHIVHLSEARVWNGQPGLVL